jgi:hypothetical protein
MKKIALFFALLCLTGLVSAAPTDGNYTLTQHNLTGGGNVTPDNNFASFASAGEPVVLQNTSDNNAALAAGFWGTPFAAVLVEVAEAAEEVGEQIIMILMPTPQNQTTMLAIIMVFGATLIFVYALKKKREKKKEGGEKENEA